MTLASKNLLSLCPQESGDDEYQGDQSDTEDEVDSDFDIDEGDEPSSDGEAEEPRRKRRIVTKAYKVQGKSWFSWTSLIPILPSSGPVLLVPAPFPTVLVFSYDSHLLSPYLSVPWCLIPICPQEPLKSLRPRKVSTPAGSSQKTREEKTLLPLELQDDGSDSE